VKDTVEEDLEAVYESEGIAALQKLLQDHDPEYYKKVDRNNPQRLLRALAVAISTGQPYSAFRKLKSKKRNFISIPIGLTVNREELYRRINARVEEMMKNGLLEEVKRLQPFQHLNALQTVGYSELFDYLNGLQSLDDSIELIKQHTRNYAKRQMTWFRKSKGMTWFSPGEVGNIIEFITSKING
jgi:tRNA dimethylallyltransferase